MSRDRKWSYDRLDDVVASPASVAARRRMSSSPIPDYDNIFERPPPPPGRPVVVLAANDAKFSPSSPLFDRQPVAHPPLIDRRPAAPEVSTV